MLVLSVAPVLDVSIQWVSVRRRLLSSGSWGTLGTWAQPPTPEWAVSGGETYKATGSYDTGDNYYTL